MITPLLPQDERGVFTPKFCEACRRWEGIEPLWTIREAAVLIPFKSEQALTVWLCKHRSDFPSRIRVFGYRKIRVLTTSEILEIRKRIMYVRPGRGHPFADWRVQIVRHVNGPQYVKSEARQAQEEALAILMGKGRCEAAKPHTDR